MRLLIITQKIDKSDDVLGFFHLWVRHLSKKAYNICVIANYVGEYDLPKNVKIFSLGKEKGYGKLRRYLLFLKHLLGALPGCDGVFAHMCPEYVLAMWPLNLFFRKKVVLWYIHKSVTWKLKLANRLVYKIFTATKNSIKLKSKKIVAVGHGIDTDSFKETKDVKREDETILYIGRITPIKRIDCLIEAAKILDGKNIDFRLSIVGSPLFDSDKKYEKKLRTLGRVLLDKGKMQFFDKVKNSKTPEIYNYHDVFVNLSPQGLFDKAVLEAMACKCLVLISNRDFESAVSDRFIFKEKDAESLAEKLQYVFGLKEEEKNNFRDVFRSYVVENHNLEKLSEKIIKSFNNV